MTHQVKKTVQFHTCLPFLWLRPWILAEIHRDCCGICCKKAVYAKLLAYLVKFSIPIYSNLGSFVNRFHKSFNVDPKLYLSSSNQVDFVIEWANKSPSGIRSKDDRAVGTGAFIYKAEIEATFSPNLNNPEVKNDEKIIKNFSTKSSFEQKRTFGIKRTK